MPEPTRVPIPPECPECGQDPTFHGGRGSARSCQRTKDEVKTALKFLRILRASGYPLPPFFPLYAETRH